MPKKQREPRLLSQRMRQAVKAHQQMGGVINLTSILVWADQATLLERACRSALSYVEDAYSPEAMRLAKKLAKVLR